jgi:type II secretory pathway pseudopilin PulG
MGRVRERGLSLVEVVFAVGIIATVAVAVLGAISSSVTVTRQAKPVLIAEQAATRIIEELRSDSRPFANFYTKYWGGPTVAGAGVANNNTPGVYVGLDGVGSTYTDILDPAVNRGVIRPPADGGQYLRLRFLSEAAYNALWNLTVDLDQNGSSVDGIARDGTGSTRGPNYRLYAVRVEVHWQDASGPHVHRAITTLIDDPIVDPSRS